MKSLISVELAVDSSSVTVLKMAPHSTPATLIFLTGLTFIMLAKISLLFFAHNVYLKMYQAYIYIYLNCIYERLSIFTLCPFLPWLTSGLSH